MTIDEVIAEMQSGYISNEIIQHAKAMLRERQREGHKDEKS